jgi:hypothetical protein
VYVYTAAVSHRPWLSRVQFVLEALEGTVPSEVGMPDLSHIPIGGSRME